MDFLNKGKEMLSQGGNTGAQQQGQPAGNMGGGMQQGNAGQEDYGDKGLDFIEKKTGHTMGRNTNEKITDGARGLYEKATGFVFPSSPSPMSATPFYPSRRRGVASNPAT
ncbi:hypothetical protein EG329_013326 [Mollisiaceae sp. DMI_Dod_QoI]|nr:hypothetical protein EG329_013326 [Helotiales sp. DMI_Dod_QoI]